MLYFPQLASGAITQFPFRKTRTNRTISTSSEDGHRVALADPEATRILWTLSYEQLSDDEAYQLSSFFEATEGSLNSFTFFDPAGNLLSWSEDLNHPVWQRSSFLQASGSSDPLGTSRGFRIANTGAGALPLEQTINVPGNVTCCFSVYARSEDKQTVTLNRKSAEASTFAAFPLSTGWSRLTLSGKLDKGDEMSTFQVIVDSGQTVELFGFQVEPQPAASKYAPSFADSGVFSARLDGDSLALTASAPNRTSCVLRVVASIQGS